MKKNKLGEIIQFNNSFKTSINLYLSLNKIDKVMNYIPTKSSVAFMNEYINAVLEKKEQATLFVGPYGKGKSHLLLVLLAILSLERNEENTKVINELIAKIKTVDEIGESVANHIQMIWEQKKFLPVIINDSKGDLNQAFLFAINDALKREKLDDICPETFYSIAVKRILNWKNEYPETFSLFEKELENEEMKAEQIIADLRGYSKNALSTFIKIYPKVTSGSEFNPLAVSEVLPLYKSISDILYEDYGYSGIYIVFDEFSKFIEGQSGSRAGLNMKLLQDICELASNSSNSQIYFTMVAHKSIKEYGKYLSQEIINQFTGIEGRIIEKYFVTSSKNNYELIKNAIVKDYSVIEKHPYICHFFENDVCDKYYSLPAFRIQFSREEFTNTVLKGCYPLNPISAYLLLNVSEKVAQNERTLFTFISNDEPNSMARFVTEHSSESEWIIGADLIYDYFQNLFKKEVSNELVHSIWLGADYALSRCLNDEEKRIIKALAVIKIVNKEDELPADEKYLPLAVSGIDNLQTIDELVSRGIIYKKSATGSYTFKTIAGSTLKNEIKTRRNIKGDNVNYSSMLEKQTGKYYVVPRKYNTIHSMTRYFKHEYMDVDTFLNIEKAETLFNQEDGADGKVITLYSFSEINQNIVCSHVQKLNCNRLVIVIPHKTLLIKSQLKDYEIIQEMKTNQVFIHDHEILKKELPLLEEDLEMEIENNLSDTYANDSNTKVCICFNGEINLFGNTKEEKAVNYVCESLFTETPIINNEIVNRNFISTSQTKKARISIINSIMSHTDDENFYSGTNQEATIYRSLFVRTKVVEGTESKQLKKIIQVIDEFIESCCDNKLSLSELIEILTQAPYGMRRGIIPFYVAYVISKRNEDLVIYYLDSEIQLTAEIIVNMCEAPSDYKLFVSREDIEKEKYIKKLNTLFDVENNRNLSDNRIKNIMICMQRWFRSLPQVTRNHVCFNEYINDDTLFSMVKYIKNVLQKSEVNPFEVLFIDFTSKFGTVEFTEIFEYIYKIKSVYDAHFEWVQDYVITTIYSTFNEKRKMDLYHTLKEWYERQSELSKQGLHDGRITNFMSCIEKINSFDDYEVAQKLVKAITDIYIENWTEHSLIVFKDSLETLKNEVERIRDENTENKLKLTFVGKNGSTVERFYERANESEGTIFRNYLEDIIEENDDLSVNSRVAIMLEMIEKMIG